MDSIQKKIVTNELMQPIAVQIDYKDWQKIERLLAMQMVESKPLLHAEDRFGELLTQTRGLWRGEEGLAYQTRIREEWDRS